METTREYPDIDFVETDTETIENSMIALYEYMKQQEGYKKYKVQPASPERLFIAYMAAIIIQQRVLTNETAKQNVPRYAKGDYLDSLGELFKDTPRLPASSASALFRCYISQPQGQSVIIPKGTRITYDGEIVFATTETLEIPQGEIYGDVVAVCNTPGTVGNDLDVGEVKEIVDIYDYYLKVENITKTSGGAAEESDANYYERMRESMESFSTAGPIGGYVYHTKSAMSSVADVAATSPTPGVVDVRILLQNGEQPTESVLQEIREALNADNVRPLTDTVQVSIPDEDNFEIDFTYYIPKNSQTSSNIIAENVSEAVRNYIKWQTEKMGRDINPSYLNFCLMATGIKRCEIRKPEYAPVAETHVARLQGEIVALNGGIEDV